MTDTRATASELFDAVWLALRDVIGPTATATLLERSVKRAGKKHPQLADVAIVRHQFEYSYTLPPSWKTPDPAARKQFQAVVDELWPLLSSLTGTVVVRRLGALPLLAECGVIPSDTKRKTAKDTR